MEKSATIQKVAKALLEAQKEMGSAVKESTNPFFKSRYADLNAVREACMPALNTHGISVIQPVVYFEGKNFVNTVLLHESGEFLSGLTEIIYSKANDAQSQGSGITYARRYGLQSFVNIGVEDDDGNAGSAPKSPESPKTPAKTVPEPTMDQKLSAMNPPKTPMNELTIDELEVHQKAINLINTPPGLTGYYNSLAEPLKENKSIQSLLTNRREELKKK